jgi:hypothetical protein
MAGGMPPHCFQQLFVVYIVFASEALCANRAVEQDRGAAFQLPRSDAGGDRPSQQLLPFQGPGNIVAQHGQFSPLDVNVMAGRQLEGDVPDPVDMGLQTLGQ